MLLEGSEEWYRRVFASTRSLQEKTTYTPPSAYTLHTIHPRNTEGKREEIEQFAAIEGEAGESLQY